MSLNIRGLWACCCNPYIESIDTTDSYTPIGKTQQKYSESHVVWPYLHRF